MEKAIGSRYVIGERLGAGGMGTVYRATRRDGGPERAIKVLRPELAEDPVVLTRFIQERTLMLQLRDEHLVAVEDLIVDGDTVAIVMELIGGGTLRRHAADTGPMAAPTALRLTRQVLLGLDVVHRNGVVHRDVKPENVLLDRPEGAKEMLAKVSDFGIARLLDSPRLTGTFNYIGTPHYCAPELANGAAATPAVDVFATGVMLYELLAGTTPFAGLAPAAVIRRQMQQAPPQSPLIPEALWSVVSRWMNADPAARPPDARQAMLEIDDLIKMMTSPTMALPAVLPAQADPQMSQPGQAPLRAAGLAAGGIGGSALAGPPPSPGLAPTPVAPDYLEVLHTPPPQSSDDRAWPRLWPSQQGYDGTPPLGLQMDHPSIVPGFEATPPPPVGGHPTPVVDAPAPPPRWDVDTGEMRKIQRPKGLLIGAAAVVVVAGATGTVVAVAGSGGGGGSARITTAAPSASPTLRFPEASFPALGVTENRTWTVTGGEHPTLHGVLVFHTTKAGGGQINELLPKSMVSDASRVTFRPEPKVILADPVVQYTLPDKAGQTVTDTYDVPVSASDVSLNAMQRWAAEQIAESGDAYRKSHALLSMGFQAGTVSVPAGSQAQLQLLGKQADGAPAPSVAFGGAAFKSADPTVATVSKLGVVTGVSPGTTEVTGMLNNLRASVLVTVTPASTAGTDNSPGASPTPSDSYSSAVPTTVPPTVSSPPITDSPPPITDSPPPITDSPPPITDSPPPITD
ncbi:MAG TPA: protein kinase, partial [Frankiaceae bacterium]|nr:protein kinase [Frankiaceae bacterium]